MFLRNTSRLVGAVASLFEATAGFVTELTGLLAQEIAAAREPDPPSRLEPRGKGAPSPVIDDIQHSIDELGKLANLDQAEADPMVKELAAATAPDDELDGPDPEGRKRPAGRMKPAGPAPGLNNLTVMAPSAARIVSETRPAEAGAPETVSDKRIARVMDRLELTGSPAAEPQPVDAPAQPANTPATVEP
jgi:hypothetical protein